MQRVLSLLLSVLLSSAAAAQEPSHPLLASPTDPLAYNSAKARVLDFSRNGVGSAVEMEPLAEQLVRDYPLDGDNWFRLGAVKKALGKDAEAADAYLRAGPLIGWGMTLAPRFLAAHRLVALGRRDEAIALIRQEIEESRTLLRYDMYDWSEFAMLRADPEFRELAGRPDVSGLSREEGWLADLDYLHGEVLRVDPDYRAAPPPADFAARYAALKAAVPQLSDEQIFVRINHMLAALGHGHTGMFMPTTHASNLVLPVKWFLFPEGLFIVDANAEHAGLIGARVTGIGGTPTADALSRVGELISAESEMFRVYQAAGLLRRAPYLVGLGLAPEAAAPIRLTIEGPGGGASRDIDVVPDKAGSPVAFKLLPAPPRVPTPLFLSRQAEHHWHVAVTDHDAVFVQLNNVLDEEGESLAAYGLRLRRDLASADPSNLIVDLRQNTGGATALYPEFLRTVVGFSQQPGKTVYVLIGRATYSSASNLSTELERLADPVFVGEATSQCCSFAGDPTVFKLPYTQALVQLSAVRWNLSGNVFDGRAEISPEVPVQLTAAAYFAGTDPALETVYRLIAQKRLH